MQIGLLPLDTRPCNYGFPCDLGVIAGHAVIVPPREILGRYMEPGDFVCIREWLLDVRRRVEAWVVSIDMLCYGGIETSRDLRVSQDEALRRLEVLRELREVHAFNVIMRSTITPHSEEMLPLWRALWEFHVYGKGEVSVPVLNEYREARRRNRAVNLHLLDRPLAERVFFQDDAGEQGPHVDEARELARRGATIMAGADEAGMMLVMKLLGQTASFSLTVIGDPQRVALYEDRSIGTTLRDHGQYLNCRFDGGRSLTLVAPAANSCDRFLDEPPPPRRYNGAPSHGILVDCADANGADPALMAAIDPFKLGAFAAWNTASNSIGTALCHALAGPGDGRFLKERLLDDWLYQSVVRRELRIICQAEKIDRFQVGERFDDLVNRRLHELSAGWDLPPFRAFLPWGRLFEVEIEWH